MIPWTEARLLALLRGEGAGWLERVGFRWNRRTIWSITGGGRRLNLHAAYRSAPAEVVVHFAALLRGVRSPAGRRHPTYRRAAAAVRRWPGLGPGLDEGRRRARGSAGRRLRRRPGPGPCCATPSQRRWLRSLYLHLAATRFREDLPDDIPVRLSRRMTSRLGHMRGGTGDGGRGGRTVVEIALSLDLMLPGNEDALVDTLVHEMAHAADWLHGGNLGHGPGWKRRARRAGCSTRARCGHPMPRRRRAGDPVTRVPPETPQAMVARLRPMER